MGFHHACAKLRQFRIILIALQFLLCFRRIRDAIGTIEFACDAVDALGKWRLQFVEIVEVILFCACGFDGFRQFECAFAAFEPVL